MKFTVFLIFLVSPWFVHSKIITGVAKLDGKIVYTEKHSIDYTRNQSNTLEKITTEYSNGAKDLGRRISIFRETGVDGNYIPEVAFSDKTNNESYNIEISNKVAVLKSDFNGKNESTKFKLKSNQITTPALVKYILENFDSLQKETSYLDCLLPSSHRFIKVAVKKYKIENDLVTFSIQAKSIFLKLFSDTTYVTFNLKDRSWVSYKGYSNLKDKDGKSMKVEISYH